jgi:sulfur carrier protein ThiS
MINVTVTYKGKRQEFTFDEDSKLAELVSELRSDLGLPATVLMKVDDIHMDGDYRLRQDDQVELLLAEITYGPNARDISEYVGQSLASCLARCGQALNVPTGANLETEVNGKSVDTNHAIQAGDRIELAKKKGRKL